MEGALSDKTLSTPMPFMGALTLPHSPALDGSPQNRDESRKDQFEISEDGFRWQQALIPPEHAGRTSVSRLTPSSSAATLSLGIPMEMDG